MKKNSFHETVWLLVKKVLGYNLRKVYANADGDEARRTTVQDALTLVRANPHQDTHEFIASRIKALSKEYLAKARGTASSLSALTPADYSSTALTPRPARVPWQVRAPDLAR